MPRGRRVSACTATPLESERKETGFEPEAQIDTWAQKSEARCVAGTGGDGLVSSLLMHPVPRRDPPRSGRCAVWAGPHGTTGPGVFAQGLSPGGVTAPPLLASKIFQVLVAPMARLRQDLSPKLQAHPVPSPAPNATRFH